jgi:vacuolar-type H+-ATPase subunit H
MKFPIAIINEDQFKGLSGSALETAKEENSKLLSQFQQESEKYTADLYKAIDSGDQERIARARLGIIEQRMKYIIANANKAARSFNCS